MVMMNAKRRRSEPSENPSRHRLSRDCYEDVVGLSEESPGLDSTVRSSWLSHTEWIRSSFFHEADPADDGLVQEEIKSLQATLCQVKRRLGPAAERCTEAFNSGYHSSTTTGYSEFVEARRACNPYEVLGEGQSGGLNNLFMNRSAIKLANVDALLDFYLTRYSGEGPFVFADLCGAPGGFSEYILRRCYAIQIPACRGYGMSLTGVNEYGQGTPWKLQDAVYFENGTCCQYRVCEGADGTGDIFRWDNVQALRSQLVEDSPQSQQQPEETPVHLVLADGGFDAQRDSEHQEELSQKLVVCEVAAGLALLRPGGTLVIKMFGFQTAVIRTVMKDLFFFFESMVALKPISSRPASAERYVVCTGFKGLPQGWDGLRWRNHIFLGESISGSGSMKLDDDEEEVVNHLYHYLDQFDCDLLNLNLKACFSILSYLERKVMVTRRSSADMVYLPERPFVNVESYKYAWRLTP
jgi:cap1 methyltransferase